LLLLALTFAGRYAICVSSSVPARTTPRHFPAHIRLKRPAGLFSAAKRLQLHFLHAIILWSVN